MPSKLWPDLLDIDRLLGRGLEVGDVALRLAPRERSLLCNDAAVDINLIAQDDEREIVGVARAGLDEELVTPRVEVVKRLWLHDVEDQHTRVSTTIKCHAERLKALLPCRVPDLHLSLIHI